jgi:hypothetical protein
MPSASPVLAQRILPGVLVVFGDGLHEFFVGTANRAVPGWATTRPANAYRPLAGSFAAGAVEVEVVVGEDKGGAGPPASTMRRCQPCTAFTI